MMPESIKKKALVKMNIPRKDRASVNAWTNWNLEQKADYINDNFFEVKEGKLIAKKAIKNAKIMGGITFKYDSAACGEAGFSINQFASNGTPNKSFGKTGFHLENKCDGIDIRADVTDIEVGDYFTLNMYHSVKGAANNLEGSYIIFV